MKKYHLPNRKALLFFHRLQTTAAIFTVIFVAFLAFYMNSLTRKLLIIDFVLLLCFIGLFILFSACVSFTVSLKENAILITLRNLNIEVLYSLIDEVKIIEDKFYDRELIEISLKSNIIISKYFLFLGLHVGFRKKTKESKQVIVFSVKNARELYEELKRIVEKDNG